jgi:bifunctional enzyme CysN/CysC
VVLTGALEAPLGEVGAALEEKLVVRGRFAYYLGLRNAQLGLSSDETNDRPETLRRLGETAHLFTDAGAIFVTSVPELDEAEADLLRALARPADVAVFSIDTAGAADERATEVLEALTTRRIVPEYDL